MSDFWRCYWQVDMHTYQCFGPFWNAVHNDDAGKDLHYLVSCAYAYQVGERFLWSLLTLVGSRTIPLDIFWRMESWECWPLGLEWPHLRMVHFMSSGFFFKNIKSGLQGQHLIPTSQVEFLRLWMLAQMDAYEYTEKGAGWFFWSAKQQVVGRILLLLSLWFLHFWLSSWFLHLPLLLWLSFCCCCRGFCIIVTCKYSEFSVVIFDVYWNHFRVKPTTGSGATWVCCSWVLLLLISAQGRPSVSWRLAFVGTWSI